MTITLEALVPVPAERDELVQLLYWIATEWHQNDQVFEHRQLADWPQWCEDQGFRFDLLKSFFLQIDRLADETTQSGSLEQWVEGLDPGLTIGDLLALVATERPRLLAMFEAVSGISSDESQELMETAGGTSKGRQPGKDIAFALGGVMIGVGGTLLVQKLRRMRAASAERLENLKQRDVSRVEEYVSVERPVLIGYTEQVGVRQVGQEFRQDAPVARDQAQERIVQAESDLRSTLEQYQKRACETLERDLEAWILTQPERAGSEIRDRMQSKLDNLIDVTNNQMQLRFNQEISKLTNATGQEVRQDVGDQVRALARSFAEEEEVVYQDAMEQLFVAARENLESMLVEAARNEVPAGVRDIIEDDF